MSFVISIVTWNRKDVLARVIDGIHSTCPEQPEIFVSDNGSEDGTALMLQAMEASRQITKAICLPENKGIAIARNAHWGLCMGKDTVRMDDKVLALTPRWLTIWKSQSDWWQSILGGPVIIGSPYDPTVRNAWLLEPLMDFIRWDKAGEGGPIQFIPAELTEMLGAWDELPGVLYGWEDVLYNHRARLLGGHYGFSLRAKFEFLASASTATRARAMDYHPIYMEARQRYSEGLLDVFIDPKETEGYRIEAPLS